MENTPFMSASSRVNTNSDHDRLIETLYVENFEDGGSQTNNSAI